jgi:endothelin-converting enzyme/putative endopeptidase
MRSRSAFAVVLSLTGALLGAPCAAQSAATEPAASATLGPLDALPHTPSLDLTDLDRTTDPCIDFYRYSCGGWRSRNPIPPDQANWSVYGKLYQDNQRFLWGILENLAHTTTSRSESQQKIGDYFAACMDESAIEKLGAQPLAPLLTRIANLRSKRELPGLLADVHLQTPDSGFLFGFGSNQDYADSTQIIGFAEAGGLGLPDRDYYTDTDAHAAQLRTQYKEHVARMFELLGDSPAAAARNATIVLRLETRLAQASLKRVDRRDPHKLFHKLDRAALQRLTPEFVWAAYLQPLGLADIAKVNVSEPKFYAAIGRLLTDTNLADLKTYLRWHAAHSAAPFLSSAFEDERFAFYDHTLRGVSVQQPRWKRCVRQVDRLLGEALGQEFVARAFGPELKASTLKMTTQIEQAMRADLENLSWMSAPTKHQALVKLDSIVNKIGYPDRWRDYSAVAIQRDDFYGNVVRATEFESRRQLAKIGKPLDRSEWGMTPPTVNAYFDPQMNDINFPAGVLQPPLYDPAMDDAPNYGNTGGTIGHELTHAFDDEGRQYDAAGNLADWWTIADAQKFKQRAQCIVDQYAQYPVVDGIHINSRLTLGEDVADLGGLILAHMAWIAQTAGQTLQDQDGLTPEQRFFVGYAQWACENDRPENLRLHAKTDPHSPGRYRVNGLVINMPEFERAFACKAGQPMVTENRCRVW